VQRSTSFKAELLHNLYKKLHHYKLGLYNLFYPGWKILKKKRKN